MRLEPLANWLKGEAKTPLNPLKTRGIEKHMKLVNIGYGNMVNTMRIVSVVSPDAAPIKRLVQDTRNTGKLVDATAAKRQEALLFPTAVI